MRADERTRDHDGAGMTSNIPASASKRRTKIVATVGPATRGTESLEAIIEAGANVLRLNFSHATHDEARLAIERGRKIARRRGQPLAILQDLQGPRLRIGELAEGEVTLVAGRPLTLTTTPTPGDAERIGVSYERLPSEVGPGDVLLLNDGLLRLRVTATTATDVRTVVEVGGVLPQRKGINAPGANLSAPSLSEKDVSDLEFGLRAGVDYVALSFVRSAADAGPVREVMARLRRRAPIIAKIEQAEAVEAIDEIARAFDGVMVARGDLGVEVGPEYVPLLQKRIIHRCNVLGKPVITATQMLESMVSNPTPTRAEASDVANAVLDGTDAVMLSAETSVGKYPAQAVEFMDRIASEADAAGMHQTASADERHDPARAVIQSAHNLANSVHAAALTVFTSSGRTALLLSKHRPSAPVFAFTGSAAVYQRMALYWGVTPVLAPIATQTREMIGFMENLLADRGLVRHGERIVVVGSTPLTSRGRTNFLKVHTVQRRGRRSRTPEAR